MKSFEILSLQKKLDIKKLLCTGKEEKYWNSGK